MIETQKRFVTLVLIPLQLGIVAAAVISLCLRLWWWLAGFVVAWYYLGSVFATLHEIDNDDSCQGSRNDATGSESRLIPNEQRLRLLREASIRIMHVVGIGLFFLLLAVAHWRWLWAALAGYGGHVIVGAILLNGFRLVDERH